MLHFWLSMSLVAVPGGTLLAADLCASGDASARLECLVAQRCPTAASNEDHAACYREIALALLAPDAPAVPAGTQEVQPQVAAPAVTQPEVVTGEKVGVVADAVPTTGQAQVPVAPEKAAENVARPAREALPVTAAQTEAQARAAFGLDWQEVDRVEIKDVTARVTGVTRQPRGTYLFRLDNGQLWEQTEKRRLKMAPGDEIRIARMSLRSFKLFPATGTSSKVRRLDCDGSDADSRCGFFDGS